MVVNALFKSEKLPSRNPQAGVPVKKKQPSSRKTDRQKTITILITSVLETLLTGYRMHKDNGSKWGAFGGIGTGWRNKCRGLTDFIAHVSGHYALLDPTVWRQQQS